MSNKKKPLVSISCITYNHEKYIEQCLNGFFMQKTNFEFEILIHDDASTDKTQEIIKKYEKKFPGKIKAIYQKENQYSKGVRGIMSKYNFPRAQGKYIALCEGDDYWTDPYKLQKQVDFLETNEEYSMIFHNATFLSMTKNKIYPRVEVEDRNYTSDELFLKWIAPTASLLFKKKCIDNYKPSKNIINGDIHLILQCADKGKVKGMSDKMSVYRIHDLGLSMSRMNNNYLGLQKKYIKHYKEIRNNFQKISKNAYLIKITDVRLNLFKLYIAKFNPIGFYYLLQAIFENPQLIIKALKKIKKI